MKFEILEVKDKEKKAEIVQEVLYDLPEWFGLPESTQAYIDESRTLKCIAAYANHEVIGCITMKPTSEATVEIHAMGVKKKYHRYGVGRKLYEAFEHDVKKTFRFIQVKTVAEGHYEAYDQTISFYRTMGFHELEVFSTLWDEWNPCLIMVKNI